MKPNIWAIRQKKIAYRFYILRVATLLKIHVCCGLMNIYCIKLKQTCCVSVSVCCTGGVYVKFITKIRLKP
jgi:hypothetical protein